MFPYKKGAECMTGAMRRVFLSKRGAENSRGLLQSREEHKKMSRINMAEDIPVNGLGKKRDSIAFRFNSDQTNES